MSILNTTTSTTRPDDASVGAIYFETDTNRMILWDGTAWREYNADSSSFPPGEYIIVKDNYNTSSAPNSGATWFYSSLFGKNVQYGHSYNARRIDLYGTFYGIGYNTHNWSSLKGINWNYQNTQSSVSEEYNLSKFQSSNPDDVMIDAIRFRCKRQNPGLGYFGINRLFFIKGPGNFTINTPYVYSTWFSGANNPPVSGSVAEVYNNYLVTQWYNYAIGYRGRIDNVSNRTHGSQFINDPDKAKWICADGSGDCTWGGSDPNHFYNNIKETDPLGREDNKTENAKWSVFRTNNASSFHIYDSDSGYNFNHLVQAFHGKQYHTNQGFGVRCGVDGPAELYFTFYFETPLNFTNLEAMCYDVICDQMNQEVTFEFRKAQV